MSLFKNKPIMHMAIVGFMSLLCVAMFGLANPGHAAADAYKSDRDCTDSSSEFNVVFVARVYDYQGNLKGFADNYNFHVHAKEVWLNYRDYGPWNGTWRNTKQLGHDDYKQNSAGQWQWRDWKAWVPYTSDMGDMGWPTGHDQYSNETNQWMKLKSEAIRLWDGGNYYKTGVNADFTVAMNSNFTGTTAATDGMAYAGGNACKIPDNGGTMAPAYAFRDGDNTCHVGLNTANSLPSGSSTGWCPGQGHELNNHSWSLSCLGGNDINSPGSAIDNMWFDFSMNSWNGYYVTSAWNYTGQVQARGGGSWTSYSIKAANTQSRYVYLNYYEPAPPVVSTSTSIDGTDVEEGQPFTAHAGLTNSSGAVATGVGAAWDVWLDKTNNATLDVGDLRLGTSGMAGLTLNPGTGYYPTFSGTAIGGYSYVCTRLYNFTSSNGTIFSPNPLAPVCKPIIRKPFFQVFKGDANATASLTTAAGCTANTLSPISAFNKGNVPAYTGSGAQIAVFAAGLITEFTSGIAPKNLTFANNGPGGSQALTTYGGGFQNTYCIPDYWGAAPITNQIVDASTGTIVTNGDVFVTGSPDNSAASFGIGSIPFRWIVANNIYISSGVTRLEGNYIAKGKIYTCATGIGAPVPITSMGGSCGTPLTVTGTFIAGNGIKLQRTFGTLSSLIPAEGFTYSPDVWIQAIVPNTNVPASANRTVGKYDSITLLPPVL